MQMNQPVSPASSWITWRSALGAALAASAVATGLVACSGSNSSPPPLRELVLLAGTVDEGGPGRQDGVGTAARLRSPQGMAFDAQGNLYVADTGNQLLRKITPEGVVSTVLDIAKLPAPIDAEGHETVYSNPTQVAFDPQGRLHVALNQIIWPRSRASLAADPSHPGMASLFSSWVVLRVAADGGTSIAADPAKQAGGALATGSSATGLLFDAQGSLYAAGVFRCTIFKGDATGRLSPFAQYGVNPGQADCIFFDSGKFGVGAMAFDPGGNLCFATVDGEVRCAKANGQQIAVSQVQPPLGLSGYRRGMAFAADGTLYLSARNRILKMSPAGVWNTLAGDPNAASSEDGSGTAARFNEPSGLALDRVGNLFVADTGNHTIRRITPDGRVTTVAGLAPQGNRLVDALGADARFGPDFALAADGKGQIYVADFNHHVVRRIAPDGSVTTLAGAADTYAHADGVGSNARFWGPFSIAVDAAGNALATDALDLRTISPAGEVRTLPLFDTGGGTIDTLATGGNGTWLAITRDFSISVAASIVVPPGLGGGSQARSYFGIHRLDRAGKATTIVDGSESLLRGANMLGLAPAGLAGDDAGRVVFTLAHAVFELSRDGVLILLAGQMAESGSVDGTGSEARFSSPQGVALDVAGNVYVADKGNHTIRKITRSGEVSTILGRAGQPGVVLGGVPGGLLEPRAVAVVPGGLVIASRQAVLLARP